MAPGGMLAVRQTQRLKCRNFPEQIQQPNECSETVALIPVSLRSIAGFAFQQVLPSGTRCRWQRACRKPDSESFGIVTKKHTSNTMDRNTHPNSN